MSGSTNPLKINDRGTLLRKANRVLTVGGIVPAEQGALLDGSNWDAAVHYIEKTGGAGRTKVNLGEAFRKSMIDYVRQVEARYKEIA